MQRGCVWRERRPSIPAPIQIARTHEAGAGVQRAQEVGARHRLHRWRRHKRLEAGCCRRLALAAAAALPLGRRRLGLAVLLLITTALVFAAAVRGGSLLDASALQPAGALLLVFKLGAAALGGGPPPQRRLLLRAGRQAGAPVVRPAWGRTGGQSRAGPPRFQKAAD